jgi:hypothetical protein
LSKFSFYYPFPIDFRNVNSSTYGERFNSKTDCWHYIHIFACAIDPERIQSEGPQSFAEEIFLNRLGRELKPEARWSYSLRSFETKERLPPGRSAEEEDELAVVRAVFDDFDEMMQFCEENFNVATTFFHRG